MRAWRASCRRYDFHGKAPSEIWYQFGRAIRACLALCLALAALAAPVGAETSAHLSQHSVRLGESVWLVLETDAASAAPIDLAALEADFQILDRRSGRSVSVRNGIRDERQTLSLRLQPRHPGVIEIRPLAFGDAETGALRLEVAAADVPATPTKTDAPDSSTVELVYALEPRRVRVAEQAILVARVLADRAVPAFALLDPWTEDARVLPLGEDRYADQTADGTMQVYERRYAVFPTQAGSLSIAPGHFDDGIASARAEIPVLDVLPIPSDADASQWLPARRLTLTEATPDLVEVRVGEPFERVIELTAEGIMASELPAPRPPLPATLDVRYGTPQRWDRRQPDGVIGTRVEHILLTAREPGRYRLPEYELDWWNRVNETDAKAILPARFVNVVGPDGRLPDGDDNRVDEGPTGVDAQTAPANPWFWISIALGVALLVMLAVGWRRSARQRPASLPPDERTGGDAADDRMRAAIDAVREAYETTDAGRARDALLTWGHLAFPEDAPNNLTRLAQRLGEPLRGRILLLDRAFYSPNPVPWHAEPVWQDLERAVQPPQ